ncbi:MAG: hypothetical protein JNJ46_22920, partial [Myxococcales bacterium]|nr:hypothetical protein [Myxococcales bacterium]
LVAGIACGGVALATGAQLSSGQAFTLREIDALTSRGNALNASTIALDIVGGVALTAGATWTIADWLKRARSERHAALVRLPPTDQARLAFTEQQAEEQAGGAVFAFRFPDLLRLSDFQGKDSGRFSTGN